tara:strand:+ start:13 stop:165 length:153 start_codon:yes stop_codon:yes gene_type:complete
MDEWEIDCEECGVGCIVHAYDPPDFCPLCGRRAEAIRMSNDIEKAFEYDE